MIYEARGERREPWEDEGAMVHLTWKQEMIGELEVVYPVVKKGAIRSIWGIHIPYIFPVKRRAVRSYLEFPNHLNN